VKPIRVVLVRDGYLYSAARNGSELAPPVLEALSGELARSFGVPCHVDSEALDCGFALNEYRGQYHSSAILKALVERSANWSGRTLGITTLDLFVPILTFVFGEAQLEGDCAVVSIHRLREEFYGLPARAGLLFERVVKESVHELGHTFGLRHCFDWRCVMASSYGVERIDVKSAEFCGRCHKTVSGRPSGVRVA